jgi:sterol 3beta-glucosyltransferase
MDFSETIEVKVLDKQEHFSVDSYFFAYFQDLPDALKQIRNAICTYCEQPGRDPPQVVLDTTVPRHPHHVVERTQSQPAPEPSPKSASGSRFSSFLRPFQETISLGRTTTFTQGSDGEEFTHIWKRGNIAITNSPTTNYDQLPASESQPSRESSPKNLTPTQSRHDHTYPPSTLPIDPHRIGSNTHHYSWSAGVPAWLRGQSRRVLGNSIGVRGPHLEHSASLSTNATGIFEVYSSNANVSSLSKSSGNDLGYSVLEAPDTLVDPEMKEKFQAAFAFDDKESLLGCTLSCFSWFF